MNQNIIYKSLVSLFIVFLIFGCSKDSEQMKTEKKNSYQPTEKDLQIESRIMAFKEKVDFTRANPGLKSGEDLTIDDAVWNIEALVNYTYADASEQFDRMVNNHDSVIVNLTNGMVSIEDAADAYDEIVAVITDHYNNIPSQDKQLIIADVSIDASYGNFAILNIRSGIGDGPPNPFAGFGTEDYWMFGYGSWNSGGYCSESIYAGTYTDSDASMQIEHKVNLRRSLPVGHSYFVDTKNVNCNPYEWTINYENEIECECCDLVNPDDPIPGDNINDLLLYYNFGHPGYNNYHECIPPNEMNFYLSGLEDLIYDISYECFPNQLEGKIFVRNIMDWDLVAPMDDTYAFHKVIIQFGTSVGSGEPPPR